MAPTSLFFLRHGQTDYNKQGIVQGGGVDSDLNSTGIKQANAFFQYYQHIEFDKVYCSTLKRTQQTLGPWKQKGYVFEEAEGLKELGWGVHEGRIPTAQQRADFLEIRNRWAQGELDLRVEAGESPREGWNRGYKFIEKVYESHKGERLLICSHGRQLRILLSGLLDGDVSKMDLYEQPNTGLHVLEMKDPKDFRVHTLSDVRHL
ncbi:MAG: histidine phosphatase family protein, partial [Bacteroidota bacterium]